MKLPSATLVSRAMVKIISTPIYGRAEGVARASVCGEVDEAGTARAPMCTHAGPRLHHLKETSQGATSHAIGVLPLWRALRRTQREAYYSKCRCFWRLASMWTTMGPILVNVEVYTWTLLLQEHLQMKLVIGGPRRAV